MCTIITSDVRDVATGGVCVCGGGGVAGKLIQKSGKIEVEILIFSGKICVISSSYQFQLIPYLTQKLHVLDPSENKKC